MVLKSLSAIIVALTLCAGLRADDGCKTCGEQKPRCAECDTCSPCEKVKRCANPVKNFFVHNVGGTIGKGFGFRSCSSCSTCQPPPPPKSDCGCGK